MDYYAIGQRVIFSPRNRDSIPAINGNGLNVLDSVFNTLYFFVIFLLDFKGFRIFALCFIKKIKILDFCLLLCIEFCNCLFSCFDLWPAVYSNLADLLN